MSDSRGTSSKTIESLILQANPQKVLDLLDLFETGAPRDLEALRVAINARAMIDVRSCAERLKNAFLSVGAEEPAELCLSLEQAKGSALFEASGYLYLLEEDVTRIQEELKELSDRLLGT